MINQQKERLSELKAKYFIKLKLAPAFERLSMTTSFIIEDIKSASDSLCKWASLKKSRR